MSDQLSLEAEAREAAEAAARQKAEAALAEAERREAAAQENIARMRREAEADRRAANVAHRTAFNRDALADLMAVMRDDVDTGDDAEAIGKAIITAIAKGQIAHVSIAY